MKKLIYILGAAAVFFTSCETSPYADFTVSNSVVEVGETVQFYNHSSNAYDYEWDFADGNISFNIDPRHTFYDPGVYKVRLAAMDDNETDITYRTITVVEPPTILEIEVLEYYDQYAVPNASIILYPTYQDWLDQTNPVMQEVHTDNNGIVAIEGLEPAVYYIDVWHEVHDNYALADEDINFIRISGMVYGEVNYFTAWVDYYEPGTRSAKENHTRFRRKSVNTEKRKYDVSR